MIMILMELMMVVVLSKDEDNFYFDEGEVHYHVHLLAHVLL